MSSKTRPTIELTLRGATTLREVKKWALLAELMGLSDGSIISMPIGGDAITVHAGLAQAVWPEDTESERTED